MSQQNPSNENKLVVVIAGPTAAGKSDVAAQICAQRQGIIVSADSVQAYRGVQIGANKPSSEERKETPHMLIDVADHTEDYNAAEWTDDAVCTVQELLGQRELEDPNNPRRETVQRAVQNARQEKGYLPDQPLLPVVCGGTMMYLQWLVHGRPDAMKPTASAVSQAQETIGEFQEQDDYSGAAQHVSSFGEIFATRAAQLTSGDWYRLRRTLEVALTVRDQENKQELIDALYTGQRQGSLSSLGYDVRCFFLCPDDRMSHTRIVDERCEKMLMCGLLKETAELSLSGCMPVMATRAIGYSQTLDYLGGIHDGENEMELFQSYLNDFTTATRRYAKKQMAWFRKDKDFMFVPVSLSMDKMDRIKAASTAIQEYCDMTREEYERALRDEDGPSICAKKKNAEQGKKMKFYHFQRHILKQGTKELETVSSQGADFRRQMDPKKRRLEE